MKKSLFVLSLGTVCVLGCNGNQGNNNTAVTQDKTVDQTSQFLSQSANQRFQSGGVSLNFGTDSSVEVIINNQVMDKVSANQYDTAQCNLRLNGKFAFYKQKVSSAAGGGELISSPMLELTLSRSELLSSTMVNPIPAGPTDPTPDAICKGYMAALLAKSPIDISVYEFTSDHLLVGDSDFFDIWNPSSKDPNPFQYQLLPNGMLGMEDYKKYFVKEGVQLDITDSFLKAHANTYGSVPSASGKPVSSDQDGMMILDAGLRELTYKNSRCGLNYVIDIQAIQTSGGTPHLVGRMADSSSAIPANAPTSTPDGTAMTSCTDLKSMLDGVPTQGLDIASVSAFCTDDSCQQGYAVLEIGKPGSADKEFGETIDMIQVSLNSKTAPISSFQ